MNQSYPKVLIVGDAAWRDDNNIGITFTNIFQNWPTDNLAYVYARPDMPKTEICNNFFQISEIDMIKKIKNKNIRVGKKVENEKLPTSELKTDSASKKYSIFKFLRSTTTLILREMLWKLNLWKTNELDQFIKEFNPDVVFLLGKNDIYMNNLQRYIMNKAKAKNAIYIVDDIYRNNKSIKSPISKIYNNFILKSIDETIREQDVFYAINELMIKEYQNKFNKHFKLLTISVNSEPNLKTSNQEASRKDKDVIRIFYGGNLSYGRLDTIIDLADMLSEQKLDKPKVLIDVYSHDIIDNKTKNKIITNGIINFKKPVEKKILEEVQSKYDILLIAESLEYKHSMTTRLSFSTKVVEYLNSNKPILAIGHGNNGSIRYLKENKAALIYTEQDNLKKNIYKDLLEYDFEETIKNANKIIQKNHNKEKQTKMLQNDLI